MFRLLGRFFFNLTVYLSSCLVLLLALACIILFEIGSVGLKVMSLAIVGLPCLLWFDISCGRHVTLAPISVGILQFKIGSVVLVILSLVSVGLTQILWFYIGCCALSPLACDSVRIILNSLAFACYCVQLSTSLPCKKHDMSSFKKQWRQIRWLGILCSTASRKPSFYEILTFKQKCK